MLVRSLFTGLLCAGPLFSLTVSAESVQPWANVSVPGVPYDSPLGGYQRHAFQTPGDWREANDTVGRIGGWQAYAAEVWEASRDRDAQPADGSRQHHDH